MNNILVVAAHPDDEVLGCGGTIARHVNNGDLVCVVFTADGISARENNNLKQEIQTRMNQAKAACLVLGVNNIKFLNFPDNKLDTIPLLDIVIALEKIIVEFKPNTVYTHFAGDLNIDHRITYQAVITACRPIPGQTVKQIYSFEVLSSTEWSSSISTSSSFKPQYYVDISNTLDKKIKALRCYDSEMRPSPHSRSYENANALVSLRGASVGISAAECYQVERILN